MMITVLDSIYERHFSSKDESEIQPRPNPCTALAKNFTPLEVIRKPINDHIMKPVTHDKTFRGYRNSISV